MIYNLKEYMKTNFPAYNYAVNGAHRSTPNDVIILNETTSIPSSWIDRTDYTVQIFSRAKSPIAAKKQILEVFSIVDRYFDTVLPEDVETLEDGSTITFTEIKAYQMIPQQKPYWFGYDGNGLAEYVFNLKVTTKE